MNSINSLKKSNISKILVSGGKGGTGKSLIATNLAFLFKMTGRRVLLVDGDVENPNVELLMGKNPNLSQKEAIDVKIFQPTFDPGRCVKCDICMIQCYKHAILRFGDSPPEIMHHLCSGCKTCMRICPKNAINQGERKIGQITFIEKYDDTIDLLIGELLPQEALSVKVISALLNKTDELLNENNYDVVIIDSPPGAHCDVEMLIEYSDFVLCVTEPTPFGEHDLSRMLQLIEMEQKKSTILINRSTISDYKEPIMKLASTFHSPVIGELPMDPIIIEKKTKGIPFVRDKRNFPGKNILIHIFSKIQTILMEMKSHDSVRSFNC